MSKPSVGELDTRFNDSQTEKLEKLTVLNENSEETIYNLIFSVSENKDNEKKEQENNRNLFQIYLFSKGVNIWQLLLYTQAK